MAVVPRSTPLLPPTVLTVATTLTNDLSTLNVQRTWHRITSTDRGADTLATQGPEHFGSDEHSGALAGEKCRTCTERKKRCPLDYDERGYCKECARLSLHCVQNLQWEGMSDQARNEFNLRRRKDARTARKARYNASLSASMAQRTKAKPVESRASHKVSRSVRQDPVTSMRAAPPTGSQLGSDPASIKSGTHSNVLHMPPPSSSYPIASDNTLIEETNLPILPQSFGLPLSSSASTSNPPLRSQDSTGRLDLTVPLDSPGPSGGSFWDGFGMNEYLIPPDEMLSTRQSQATGVESLFTASSPHPPQFWGYRSENYPASNCAQGHAASHFPVSPDPGPPILSMSALCNDVPGGSQRNLNPYEQFAQFKDYVRTLYPKTSRIVIEIESSEGPELVDLSALLDRANYGSPRRLI
ncbi:uncharacterized protein EI90DRAFT_3043785 [Cantharellus anzutake]|uniref:uncharacterized protein n=1 Tax=Cantharellus anzutake TaxID=1750568 RepID=UPI0019086E66|nr:uncharacterized protein EI90DRAFT_3043785 [Cantharellus anzutake]KAF8336833.1 hypothetical protein EI90DRAFT_3043785 [Cantharellus anzutake]